MNKFKIFAITLALSLLAILLYLEIPYENNYRATLGDEVEIAYNVKTIDGNVPEIKDEEGKIIENKEETSKVKIGEEENFVDFEDLLLGMKRWESKDEKITFPEDYSVEKIRGKTVELNFTVVDVNKCTGSLSACGVKRINI